MRRTLNRSKPVSFYGLVGLLVLATAPVAFGQDSLIADNSPAADKGGLLPVIDFYSRAYPFIEIFPICALTL